MKNLESPFPIHFLIKEEGMQFSLFLLPPQQTAPRQPRRVLETGEPHHFGGKKNGNIAF